MNPNKLTYEAWRITYQDSEQAARAAFKTTQEVGEKWVSTQAELDSTLLKLAATQAKLDALMLEYCPDEMTKEQLDNWAAHQVSVEPSEQVKEMAKPVKKQDRGPIEDLEILTEFTAQCKANREAGKPGDPGFKSGIKFAEKVHGINR